MTGIDKLGLGVAYTLAALVYMVAAVCVWSFVYRPRARFVSNAGTWDNEEIVRFAMLQGAVWPVAAAINLFFVVCWVLHTGFIEGSNWITQRVAKKLPDDQRYSGFRRKAFDDQDYRRPYR